MKLTLFLLLFTITTAYGKLPILLKPISYNDINNSGKTPDSDYAKAIKSTLELNAIWQNYSKTHNNNIINLFYTNSFNLQKILKNSSVNDTIIGNHKYVLMIFWKSYNDFHKYNMTDSSDGKAYCKSKNDLLSNHPLFITIASEMNQWCKAQITGNCEDSALRLMQLLGLPPNSTNDAFVEFWIKPEDIFRPALDSSIAVPSRLKAINTVYLKSFADFSANSYTGDIKFPFTGLGYTWDWCPANISHIGLNEYVLKGNKTVLIRRILSTKDYLKSK